MKMKNKKEIESIEIFPYDIPFKQPLLVGEKVLSSRRGLIIKLTTADGVTGYGEIAPLDGYSPETLEEAREQILGLKEFLPGKDFKVPAFLFSRLVEMGYSLLPSVVFGLETAALAHRPEDRFVLKEKVRVNALLDIETEEDPLMLEEKAEALVKLGFNTIKMKVGRRDVEADIEWVNRVLKQLPPGVLLRLDANRLWDFDTALRFGKGVNCSSIEYIEEPFAQRDQIPDFFKQTAIAVALDESLQDDFDIPEGVTALVLKPTVLGGIERTSFLTGIARQRGLKPVISSCFEVGPGFVQLLKLAASIDFDDSASGLDTLKYLERNLISFPVEIKKSFIALPPGI